MKCQNICSQNNLLGQHNLLHAVVFVHQSSVCTSREFSVDGGELGPSLKLKRFFVAEKYKEDIDQMYQQLQPAGQAGAYSCGTTY